MTKEILDITSPVGRLVMGSLYEPQTTNDAGQPFTHVNGKNIGKTYVKYWFTLAIPKTPNETHWSQTSWGQAIYKVGVDSYAQGQYKSPAFAWKITDGDSQEVNIKSGRKPSDFEGYPGHWIIRFTSVFAPGIRDRFGNPAPELEVKDAIIPGYYVQVNFTVKSNQSAQSPGLYLTAQYVALSGYGKPISFRKPAEACGFGQAPLPVGASETPINQTFPLPAAHAYPPLADQPYTPANHVVNVQPTQTTGYPLSSSTPPVQTVTPYPEILQGPPSPGVTPPPAPVRVMLPKAGGHSYEDHIKMGWTDATLIADGRMLG